MIISKKPLLLVKWRIHEKEKFFLGRFLPGHFKSAMDGQFAQRIQRWETLRKRNKTA